MNPYATTGRASPSGSAGSGAGTQGKALYEAYRKDAMAGFDRETPRHNPVNHVAASDSARVAHTDTSQLNPERPQSSTLVDLKDPIQVHLLTETALSDSKQYEILSQEEVDGLKKQCQSLTQRIESTRANLVIQAKYRDAANSMARLYSPTSDGPPGRSMLANRLSGDQRVKEAEAERQANERRCEELAAELFNLEKRLMTPHRKLLEHTAGVLQLTHKATKKEAQQNGGHPSNAMPGSPESLYTYSHGRNSLDQPEDAAFYPFDQLDTAQASREPRVKPVAIPPKSPVREQHNQLREDMERLQEENKLLDSQTRKLVNSISEMEENLERLNNSLRDTIISFNPKDNKDYEAPPRAAATQASNAGASFRSQLEYLESGLYAIRAEQDSMPRGGQDTEAVLMGLFDIIQTGFADVKRQKDDRRRTRLERGLEDDAELSDDDGFDTAEPYSLSGFSTRVQWLYSQAVTLRDQKAVLKRQIKQQRELNNKTDAEKDSELQNKQEELEQSRMLVARAEKEAMAAQTMLSDALEDLERIREQTIEARSAQSELEDRNAKIEILEASLQELQSDLAAAETDSQETSNRLAQVDSALNALGMQLDDATRSRDEVEQRAQSLERELNNQKARLAEATASKAAAEEAARSLQQELDSRQTTLSDAAKSKDTAEQTIRSLRQDLESQQATLADAVKSKEAAEQTARSLQQELGTQQATLANAIKSKEAAEQEARKIQEELESQETALFDIVRAKDVAEQAAQDLQRELKDQQTALAAKEKMLKKKEEEMEQLNMTLVELKTEATIARAELDGAYGSRAERAADMAAVRSNTELTRLQAQVDTLRSELSETVKELEEMTKETIGSEREKVDLEGKLDDVLIVKTSLEAELNQLRERLDTESQRAREKITKLQEELDSERLKAVPGQGAAARPSAGASMLSEQFRATMREERKKFQEDIREERARTRKLEEELNKLKRALGPGKSPLSPR
ncbi:hypothetical protein S40288_01669 [Stachybotrys chartarum IBT 40288]|nr:hypothetical protein S40288_01669 [Stachybotrys chartarum IBT 40288]